MSVEFNDIYGSYNSSTVFTIMKQTQSSKDNNTNSFEQLIYQNGKFEPSINANINKHEVLVTTDEKGDIIVADKQQPITEHSGQVAVSKKDGDIVIVNADSSVEDTSDRSVNYTNNSVNPNLNLTKEQQDELNEVISERYTKTDVPTPKTWENKITINEAKDSFDGLYIDDQSGNKILKTVAWKNNADKSTANYSQRVSLNVAPINKEKNVSNLLSETEWNVRLGYILGGNEKVVGENGPNLPYYQGEGLLYELFGPTRGIVFPYTPDIDFQHRVDYEETNIPHSNISAQHYKSTPPPTISLTAEFTADNKDNARYMYGVIHFLRSISKCEFGEEVVKSRNNVAGVPPPTLYLNGWGNLINNVPVVVKSFGIKLGKEKHYVHLNDLDIWLPTDISITIQMGIQFNLDKYKMKFDLNEYKKGILGTDENSNYVNYDTYNVVHSENINETYKNNSTKKVYTTQTSHSVRRFNGSGWTW